MAYSNNSGGVKEELNQKVNNRFNSLILYEAEMSIKDIEYLKTCFDGSQRLEKIDF